MSVYRYAGVWNSATTYFTDFMVVSNNLAYVAKETVTGGGEPSTNLAQWTYLPASPQVAATFPIIDGNVSLSVDGNTDLVITAGASNVLVNSPLLVSGLFNNAGNDPPPVEDAVLTWTGSNIEWVPSSPNASGKYTEMTGGSPNVTISISGIQPTGLVSLTYVHAGGGGGSQYLKTMTVGINQINLVYNTNIDAGDQIIWGVLKYQ